MDYALDPTEKLDQLVAKCEQMRHVAFISLCPQMLSSIADILRYVARNRTSNSTQAEDVSALLLRLAGDLSQQNLDDPIALEF